MEKITRDFFNDIVINVAQGLLGQTLVFGSHKAMILETEAYGGADDPASHAFKYTTRSRIMFGPPGISYVYFIYGMYHCLNVVTEAEGTPSAVLIRSMKLLTPPYHLLDGPGKICREIGITKNHNGIDLTTQNHFYIEKGVSITKFEKTPRIGISKGVDKLWRFRCIEELN